MKKLPVMLMAIVFCLHSNAQISKGLKMIGCSFNAYSQNQKKSSYDTLNSYLNTSSVKFSSISGSLKFGAFITDHIMLGILAGYSQSTQEDKADISYYNSSIYSQKSVTKTNTFSGGLFARYYQMLGKSRFAVYGQFTANGGAGKSLINPSTGSPQGNYSEGNNVQVNAFINPGIVYFATKHIAVEASFGNIGYYWQKTKTNDRYSNKVEIINEGFNSNLNFSLASLSLGVNFYFGGTHSSGIPTKNNGKD